MELKLQSVSISNPALMATVDVEFNAPITTLVGKNGAGKSAFVESLYEFAQRVTTGAPASQCQLSLSVVDEQGKSYRYSYTARMRLDTITKPPAPVAEVFEECIHQPGGVVVWRVKDEVLRFGTGEPVRVQAGIGCLSLPQVPDGVPRALADLLKGISLVPAGIVQPRKTAPSFTSYDEGWKFFTGDERLNRLCEVLATWYEAPRPPAYELDELIAEVGLDVDLRFMVFGKESEKKLGILLSGEMNFTWLSAGTLRVIEILVALVDPDVGVLLIEEPESGIHPGLLDRLLAVIESYAQGRTVILTTHSYQVVSRMTADQVRLVERHDEGTVISGLTQQQHAQVAAYLNDEGTLGEFLFDGA